MTHTVEATAWTLIHFCWQAAVIAGVYRIAQRRVLPPRQSDTLRSGLVGASGHAGRGRVHLCVADALSPATLRRTRLPHGECPRFR